MGPKTGLRRSSRALPIAELIIEGDTRLEKILANYIKHTSTRLSHLASPWPYPA